MASNAWYKDAVDFIAARSITSGTGNGVYSPNLPLTRGQFVVLLMNAYDISPDSAPAGAQISTTPAAPTIRRISWLQKVSALWAASGTTSTRPERAITRQEMFVMLYNALKLIGTPAQLPQELSDFSDAGQIAVWAQMINALVKGNVVSEVMACWNPTTN